MREIEATAPKINEQEEKIAHQLESTKKIYTEKQSKFQKLKNSYTHIVSEESKKEQSENEAKAKAILEHETIKNDLIAIYENVVKKEAELLGLVYEDEVILSKVEELLLRVEQKGK